LKFLITGGAGFIGSHLIEKLLEKGDKVINVDNLDSFYSYEIKLENILYSTGKKNFIPELRDINGKEEKINFVRDLTRSENYSFELCDIRNFEYLDKLFSKENFDMVINFAGLAGVRPSLERPLEYEDVNVRGYMNLLELCKKYEINKFIQISSSSVYGNSKTVPFKETDIVDFAISPYAATKKSGEVMGHVYHSLYGIDMFQLRFFTAYGPRQRPDLAIHKFTKMILEDTPIPFFGDGDTFRDYTFVGDIVQGVLKSIDFLKAHTGVYEILNLGESQTISLNEMVKEIERALGKKAILNKLPLQAGDVKRTYADITKAKNLIGYNPTTKFSDGIDLFVEWYKNK
jgi:UDP-glucuronate 4-epimerase